MSDEHLFTAYHESPTEERLRALLRGWQARIYLLCRRVLARPQDAEDAAQNACLEIVTLLPRISDEEHFGHFVRRVATHAALRLKRDSDTRRRHEAVARTGRGDRGDAPDQRETLHRALRRLDDDARAVIVERYFGGKTLEEIAGPLGCSPVAVWKKLEKAKAELRRVLSRSARFAWFPDAEIGRLNLASAALGGFAVKMKLAVVAAGALLLSAFLWRGGKARTPAAQEEGRPLARAAIEAAAFSSGFPIETSPASAPTSTKAPRPYPLDPPHPGWTDAAFQTWTLLKTHLINSYKVKNCSVPEMVALVSRRAGFPIVLKDALTTPTLSLEISVQDGAGTTPEGLLRGLFNEDWSFEIQPDGTLFLGARDRYDSLKEKALSALQQELATLGQARQSLDEGWDGLSDLAATVGQEERTRVAGLTLIPLQGETTLLSALHRLGQDSQVGTAWSESVRSSWETKRVNVVREMPVLEYFEELCREVGLACRLRSDGTLYFGTPGEVSAVVEEEVGKGRERDRILEALDRTLDLPAGTIGMPEFIDAAASALGVPVLATKDAWDVGLMLPASEPVTLRRALDLLKARGVRIGLMDGRFCLVK